MDRTVKAVLSRDDGAILLVNRSGGRHYQFPGGRCKPDEEVEKALHRELWEELRLSRNDISVSLVNRMNLQSRSLHAPPHELFLYKGSVADDVHLIPHGGLSKVAWTGNVWTYRLSETAFTIANYLNLPGRDVR